VTDTRGAIPTIISGPAFGAGGEATHEWRIVALEARMTSVETNVKSAVDNTAEILSILTYTKSVAGFARKHGPRVIAFVLGYLVLSGKLTQETSGLIKGLFAIT
jgi:hypothetical protein